MVTTSNQKPFLIERRPLMLKDYLLDDLSSCSSNGFKLFPRRSQCCITVRFLLEIDLNTKHLHHTKQQQQHLKRSRSKAATSTKFSALQKAVINAVKLLPFPSSSSLKSPSSQSVRKGGLLPRSLSRKLFNKSFWRKPDHHHPHQKEENEIKQWTLFREFLQEQDKLSDIQSTVITSRIYTSSSSNSNIISWSSESEFTGHSGNSTSDSFNSGNDAAESTTDLLPIHETKSSSDRVGVTNAEDSIKEWSNEEEKEQFSPVSVLDCPFKDEEELSSPSPFLHSLIRMEGAKRKLMQKNRRFQSLAQLEPVDLEKRMALDESDDESLEYPAQPCSLLIHNSDNSMFNDIKEENGSERDAKELLKLVKASMPSNNLISKAENLLLDFFMEKVGGNNASANMVKGQKGFEQEIEVAQDWLNGHKQEMFLGWEVKGNKHIYIKDMERNGKWRNLDGEKEEVALKLELEIFTSLVNEVLLYIF